MGSYGYHVVSFGGEQNAVATAKAKLVNGLSSDRFDDEPDPLADAIYYCGHGMSSVEDKTVEILERLKKAPGIEEIRYHSCDGDGECSNAWHWTRAAGARWLEDKGIFTMSFETALAVDRLDTSGDGLSEIAELLLARNPKGRIGQDGVVERIGVASIAMKSMEEGRHGLPNEKLHALVSWIRTFLDANGESIGGWLGEEVEELGAKAEAIWVVLEQARELDAVASHGNTLPPVRSRTL
jgi:hypothetical protein